MTYSDPEDPTDQRTPLLSHNSSGPETRTRKRWFPKVLNFLWGGIYAPDASTYGPIEILLNTEDVEERDRLTEKWRDNRLNELGFVGVVVRYCSRRIV